MHINMHVTELLVKQKHNIYQNEYVTGNQDTDLSIWINYQ